MSGGTDNDGRRLPVGRGLKAPCGTHGASVPIVPRFSRHSSPPFNASGLTFSAAACGQRTPVGSPENLSVERCKLSVVRSVSLSSVKRFLSRSGFSLVELLVTTLVLAIIFIGWLQICNFQAVRKEALRRLAVEKAAGYLDYMAGSGATVNMGHFFRVDFQNDSYSHPHTGKNDNCWPWPMFDANEPIGYTIDILKPAHIGFPGHTGDWAEGPSHNWAVLRLYDRHSCGMAKIDELGEKPFKTMSILLQ